LVGILSNSIVHLLLGFGFAWHAKAESAVVARMAPCPS
jgi:hypothetical protein